MTESRGPNAARIGVRLRALRADRGLSLRQLAKGIGASPSLLSQVENGKVTPSVDTLYLLAGALEVPVATFFGDAAPGPDSGAAWVVRRADRQRIELAGGVTWENLLPIDEPGIRLMEIRYPAGATSGDHLLRHAGRDVFMVLEGELVVRVGFSEHRLIAGDSVGFGDRQPHQVRNEGRSEARAIVFVTEDGSRQVPEG